MRSILIIPVMILLSVITFAQTNNPYNQRGIDYLTSLDIIQNDYDSGKARDFNEETLNYYSGLIPLVNQVSIEMVSEIIRVKNDPNFDFNRFIGHSALSAHSKQVLTSIILNPERLTDEEFKTGLTLKVDEIINSNISGNEKEVMLSLIAIAYNIPGSSFAERGVAGRDGGCWISGPNGEGPGTQAQCIAAGALVGGLIGWGICGILCALGGAVIGGVAGALS